MSEETKKKRGWWKIIGGVIVIGVVVAVVIFSSSGGLFKGFMSRTPISPISDSKTIKLTEVVLPICGDGIKQTNEECDDGDNDDLDNCRNNCKWGVCGDGVIKTLSNPVVEECDDGNTTNEDGCSSTCKNEEKIKITYKDNIGTEEIWNITHDPFDSWYGLVFEIETIGLEGEIVDITFNTDRNRACANMNDCLVLDAPWYSRFVFANKEGSEKSARENSVTTITTLAEHRNDEECALGVNNSRFRFDSLDFEGRSSLATISPNVPQTFALSILGGYDNKNSVTCQNDRNFSTDAVFFLTKYPGLAIFDAPPYIRHIANQSTKEYDRIVDFSSIQTAPFIRDVVFETTDGRTFTLQNNPDVVEITNRIDLGETTFF